MSDPLPREIYLTPPLRGEPGWGDGYSVTLWGYHKADLPRYIRADIAEAELADLRARLAAVTEAAKEMLAVHQKIAAVFDTVVVAESVDRWQAAIRAAEKGTDNGS